MTKNLVTSAYSLIKFFLERKNILPCKLNIYLDGRATSEEKSSLKQYFLGKGIEGVLVDNFIKKTNKNKEKFRKGPRCPLLVYQADSFANELFSKPLDFLSTHEKCAAIFK